MNKIAVVTDFDGTLMEQDVGSTIMKQLGVEQESQLIEVLARFKRKEIGSYTWIEASTPLLEGKREQVDRLIEDKELRDGALDFLSFCKGEQVPVTILSDGLIYYIERILDRLQVEAEQVISNPITYSDNGELRYGLQNDNAACKWCGCCKASVVRKLKQDGWSIIYIGDGGSDYYGSAFADWIFARSSLVRYLTEEGTEFYPFQTFWDVLEVVQRNWNDFLAGTAPRRLNVRVPAACSFPDDET
ncbi:MtnX-like HAD-IB family phosphatase [Paenibacillus hexagrammi]|uniref:phosphoserine phosphatase n=1 Tax=Paenibacillus hexagrammi TaxID=2908839 RepID=A0ABY3SG23_9BACL|nr:MtnX-like HAD-IB family phosphatase [Paenibacillus sp. YPD9-1]UJF32400.1 MtnX-like HAD-IB family phosphatase [Paenibacillus sp. YPD9-1]